MLSTAAERDAFVAARRVALPAAALRGALARPRWLAPLVAAEDPRNPPASKMLRALQAAFASTSLPYLPYVVALDAEAEFTSRIPPWAAFEWWARERTALGWAHGRREAGGLWGNISAASCALAGVPRPSPARLLWWADAPVYERSDWSDFYGRVRANWARLSWYTFDHEAYLCYKVSDRGWAVQSTTSQLENADAATQARQAPAGPSCGHVLRRRAGC